MSALPEVASVQGSEPGSQRFLLAMIDGGGTVPPALGMAAKLVRRGKFVRVLGDPTIEQSARSAGCEFSHWRAAPHFDSRADQIALPAQMEARNPYGQFRVARDLLICGPAKKSAQDVVATVREHPVDSVLAEAAIPGILIGAEATGLPTAALMANIYLRPTPGLPVLGSGWLPAKGVLGKARDQLAVRMMRRLWLSSLPRANAILAGYGRPPVTDLYELFDRCARVLVMTSPFIRLPGATPTGESSLCRPPAG